MILIIPNFNQLVYLKNLINQWQSYHPDYDIYVIDNGSTYEPLLDYYNSGIKAYIVRYKQNDFVGNLRSWIDTNKPEWYVISDPDISIHPATPPNFLDYFKQAIEQGYHRAGFDLIYDDIPDWNPKKQWIQGDQKELHGDKVLVGDYVGYRAPIDTTFALYTSHNSGWQAPMSGKDWGNCVRLFNAYHLPFYEHKDYLNEERKYYYQSTKKRDRGKPSAGRSHFNPYSGMYEDGE